MISLRRKRRYDAGQRIGNFLLAYFCLAFAALAWSTDHVRLTAVFVALGLGCGLAGWAKLGWLIPCTALGVLGGLQIGVLCRDPREMALFTGLGTLFGLCAGILLDKSRRWG
jgi:hypothetical protein